MKRRETIQRTVVMGSHEESKENDNASGWLEPCSGATGTGTGRAKWQTTRTTRSDGQDRRCEKWRKEAGHQQRRETKDSTNRFGRLKLWKPVARSDAMTRRAPVMPQLTQGGTGR